jgi:hypothetical protein
MSKSYAQQKSERVWANPVGLILFEQQINNNNNNNNSNK